MQFTTILTSGLLSLGLLALTACGGDSAPTTSAGTGAGAGTAAQPEGKTFKLAVIPKGNSHEFWQTVKKGVNKADADLAQVEVEFKGPATENDHSQQKELMEIFQTKGVDAIAVAPVDGVALGPVVEKAMAKGTPVLIFDSGIDTEDYVSYVATDNKKGGMEAGKRLGELLGGKGKVIMVRYKAGSVSTEQREAGFLEAMKSFPDIELISTDQEGAGKEREVADNLLAKFGAEVNGVFTSNESLTTGMMNALRGEYYKKGVIHVGFDSTPDLIASIREGELKAVVVQHPQKMGFTAVTTLFNKLQGKSVQKRIDTGAYLVDKDNLEDPLIKALIGEAEWNP